MANPFDQFDKGGGNPFNRFDAPAESQDVTLPERIRRLVAPPEGVTPGGIIPLGKTQSGDWARYENSILKGIPKLVTPDIIASPARGLALGMEASRGEGPLRYGSSEQSDIAALAGVVGGIRSPAARGMARPPVGGTPKVENVEAEPLGPKAQPPRSQSSTRMTIDKTGRPVGGNVAKTAPPREVWGEEDPTKGWWKGEKFKQGDENPHLGQIARNVADSVRAIFSPESRGPKAASAARGIRANIGAGNRDTSATAAQFDQLRGYIKPYIDEFGGYIKAMRSDPPIMPPRKPVILRMINRMEGGADDVPNDLKPVSDAISEALLQRRHKLENTTSTQFMHFVDDFFSHQWTDPERAKQVFSVGRQGSGRNLKQRWHTMLQDGLAAGLQPISLDPLEMTMGYISNMDRYIAVNRVIDNARALGDVKYYTPGNQPEGWAPLQGRVAQKTVSYPSKTGEPRGRSLRAFAPEPFALVYNNFISKGFYENLHGGRAFDAVQAVSNTMKMLELGLSAYHAMVMVVGSVASELGTAIGKGLRGEIVSGIKQGVRALEPVGATKRTISEGTKLQQQYLRLSDHGLDFAKIARIGAKVNIRITGREPAYRATAMDSFWQAWKRGTLRAEGKRAIQNIKERPLTGLPMELFRGTARVVDTIAHPIFDKLIPTLKAQAFYSGMMDYMKAHPLAGGDELTAFGTKLWDSIDDRFGEMVQDNLFWNQTTKQVARVVFLAPTWSIGILRLLYRGGKGFGEAGYNLARGKPTELPPASKYVLGAVATYAIYNAVAQYLHTGKGPSDWKDLFAYQTGGQTAHGAPERALIPGHTGEMMGYLWDPRREVYNKLNPILKLGAELIENKDYRGFPIHEQGPRAEHDDVLGFLMDMAGHVGNSFAPMSVKNYMQGAKQGTGLTTGERVLGIRTAPPWFMDPERQERMERKVEKNVNKRKHRSDRRIEEQHK